jgi:hypothetical protein
MALSLKQSPGAISEQYAQARAGVMGSHGVGFSVVTTRGERAGEPQGYPKGWVSRWLISGRRDARASWGFRMVDFVR